MFGVLSEFYFANLQNGGGPPLTYHSFIAILGEQPGPVTINFLVICLQLISVMCIIHFLLFLLQEWVAKFEKPKGDPSAFLKPVTIVLSPYLKVSFVTDLVQIVILPHLV
jgi:cryptochrome